ncbi:MauE/DoxX family redox-associated membrane protein [Actinosynnema sp. NPDC047251]|uniref:Putative membrane protein n=1 Tax=Saccharothrix espanaensis (strain ATCC 51144 / DSM 44229 / JCM 9112 / NBRC 15066 / NRRL 15764) TaxID=1179773 RepID=K0JRG2_SACES|nr:MauE/DoxX family redox-associated membrane protein [Saccharothrix espanaensis]CCH28381.1 putative membrane protein [Saccharothrix espanaensis DSM 44229]
MEYAVVACRLCLGLVFLVSVFGKVRGRSNFADFVRATGELAPALPRTPAAVAVVAGEVAVVLLLCSPWAAVGMVLATGLLMVFTAAVAMAIARGRRVRCQCFGESSAPVGLPQVVRNALLITVAVVGWWGGTGATGVPPDAAGTALALAAGAVVGGIVLLTDDVVSLFRPIQ